MTLRDDLVFLVVLYQRWLYAIDPTRPDEYGMVYDDAKPELQLDKAEGPTADADVTQPEQPAKVQA